MSHIDVGPLAGYNSLTDQHLAGYFNNTRMRKHLIKSGLITRQGEVVPEPVYRLNSSRKDHRRNVRDLLAQAIVHKTLDYERSRQVAIRQKLEEIAKIEMVRRVRAERHRKGDEDIVPLMSPRVRRPRKAPNRLRDSREGSSDSADQKGSVDQILVDSHGMPMSPDAESRARLLRKFPEEDIDSKHLYSLDSVALREYAKVLERYERGRVARSPYVMSQLPRPPTAASASAGGSRRQTPAGASGGRTSKSAGSKTKGTLVMHRPEPAVMQQSRFQSLCEVEMRYYGQSVGGAAARDDVDPAQEVLVEQQHCGGNTLIVFKRSVLPGTNFSFFSRRHRGYPFSLTFYINGVKDSRLSTCCEYRHRNGSRLGGKQGHFGFAKVKGAAPCYKCQVERGMIAAPPSKEKKKKPKPMAAEDGYGAASADYDDDEFEDDEAGGEEDMEEEEEEQEIGVAVEEDDEEEEEEEEEEEVEIDLDGDAEKDELGPLRGGRAPVEVAVESDAGSQALSPTPPPTRAPTVAPPRGARRGKRLRHLPLVADSEEDEHRLMARMAEDMYGSDSELDAQQKGEGRRKVKRKVKSKMKLKEPPLAAPSTGSSSANSTAESLSLLPSVSFEEEEEEGEKEKESCDVMEKEKETKEVEQSRSEAREESEAKADEERGKSSVVDSEERVDEDDFDDETKNDADEEVDKDFSEQKEWSIDSKEQEKFTPDPEWVEEEEEELQNEEGKSEKKIQLSESVSEVKEEKIVAHVESESKSRTLRSKGKLERSKVMEERVDGESEVGEISIEEPDSWECEERTEVDVRESLEREEQVTEEAKAEGVKEQKEEAKDEKVTEEEEEEVRRRVEERGAKEVRSSPRGAMMTSPASQPTDNEYQEDFEADAGDDDKASASEHSDAEEKDSQKSGSSKSSSASGSPRSSGQEDNEKEVDRLLRALSSSSRASIRRVCLLMAQEICFHFVECRQERRRLRRALRAARRRSDSEKKEAKDDEAKEEKDEDADVHPIGMSDEDAASEEEAEKEEKEDKASPRSDASAASDSSAASLKRRKEEEEKEKEKEKEEEIKAVSVEGDRSSPDKDQVLSPQLSEEVPVEEAEEEEKKEEKEEEKEEKKEEEKKEEEEEEEVPDRVVAISVFTGDELSAGTNSRVYCRLIGSEASSDVMQLGGEPDVDRFTRGSVDSFRQPMKGFKGELQELEVWHDGKGLGATWFLDKATILLDGKEYEFVFRNWVEGDRGDGDHHHTIPVTRPRNDEAAAAAATANAGESSNDNNALSTEASSSEDEEEDEEAPVGAAAPESSSPSSSSDEEEKEAAKAETVPTSESGPDGGNDPDAGQDYERRPLLADAADEAMPFHGNVRDFVKAPESGDGGYSVEVINVALTMAQLRELGEAMSAVRIECLNIRNGRIDDEKLEVLLTVLEQKSDLKLLNLNCNSIGAAGARQIAERIVRWGRLEMLLLHGNPLLDDGIEAIVTAIIARHLTGNRVEAMRSLDLGDSEMTNQGAYVVAQLLARDTPLDSLELTGNRKIGVDGWRRIGEAFGRNTQLHTLSVDYCGLEDQQLKQLLHGLPFNEALVSLDLEGNELSETGGSYLRDMLVENGSITDISLRPGNDRLSEDVVEELQEMARNNVDD